MSAAHTPGPWVVLDDGTPEPLKIAQAGTFASVAGLRGLAPDEEQFANARLIAAAPELLEALRELIAADAWLADSTLCDMTNQAGQRMERAWDGAKEAIARATRSAA